MTKGEMARMEKKCKHCIEVSENQNDEAISFCELKGEWINITHGNCFGNCEAQTKGR